MVRGAQEGDWEETAKDIGRNWRVLFPRSQRKNILRLEKSLMVTSAAKVGS